MKKVITGFIIINTILFFFTAVGYAVQNEDFLDYLGRKIYNTCRGRDLTIREGEFKFENGTSVTGIQWEYELEDVITVLRELSRFEPYGVYFEGDGDGRYRYVFIQGTGIITCGEHILDIKHRDYYWDGVKVNLPADYVKLSLDEIATGDEQTTETSGNKGLFARGNTSEAHASSTKGNLLDNILAFVSDIRFLIGLLLAIVLIYLKDIIRLIFRYR